MGKSSGGGDTNQTTTVNPPAFVAPYLKNAAQAASNLYKTGPQEFYPGQTYAGFDPLQTQGQQAQLNFANSILPGLNQNIFGSFNQALDASNIVDNPAIQAGLGAIENRANQNFSESILPQLRQQATGTGNMFSSKAEQSERLAGRDLQSVISNAQADLLSGSIGDAMRLQGAGLSLAPQTLGTGLFGGQVQQDIGGQLQGMDQNAINETMARFNFGQQAPTNSLNDYIAQLGGLAGNYNVSQGNTSADSSNNWLGGAIGGGLLGNALAGSSLVTGFSPLAFLGAAGGLPAIAGGAILGGLLS